MKKITISTLATLLLSLLIITASKANTKCTPPKAIAGSPATVCPGSSAKIGSNAVTGNTYAWVSNPTGFYSSVSNPVVSPTTTTTYTLTESTTKGCSKSNYVIITVSPRPKAWVGPDQSICSGKCTTIGGEPTQGSTYSWAVKGDGFNVSSSGMPINKIKTSSTSVCGTQGDGAFTTTYTLTEISSNGCTNSNSVAIKVNAQPKVNLGSPSTICEGECATIGGPAVPGDTYTWFSNPAGFTSNFSSSSVCPTVTTIYSLVELSTDGCTFANTVTVKVKKCDTEKKKSKH